MSQPLNQFEELPKGWMLTTLEELRLPVEKVSPRYAPDEPFSYIDIAAIDNSTFRVVAPKVYLGRDAPSRARQKVASGNILFSTVRTYLKNIAVVPPDLDGGVASTGFCVLNPAPEVNHRFIFYFVQTDEFVSRLSQLQRGTSYPAVRNDDVLAQEIPLPPLPEQHRIVAEIEKQFTRLDASVASLERVRANLRRYRTSVLKAACNGKLVATEAELARAEGRQYEHADELLERILKERRALWESQPSGRRKYKEAVGPDVSDLPPPPEGWAWATVGQLGTIGEQPVLTGPFGTNLRREDFVPTGVPVLTIGCLAQDGILLNKAVFVSDEKASELSRYSLRQGDLLFSRMATVGRAGIVGPSIAGCLFNYHIMRLRLDEDTVLAKFYLAYVQGSTEVSRYVRKVNHGATRDGINTAQLLRMPVAVPPVTEQHRIVAEVERRLSVIQEVEAAVDASLKRAERLRQSVLKQAFYGRLVPQDPGDEPASALLERICAERAEAQAAAETNRTHGRRTRRSSRAIS